MKPGFISSISKTDHRVMIALAALLGIVFFLLTSAAKYRIGFPLDDAWIHQTYARNLAWNGDWAFRPGVGRGGSTSPLWTALLSIGYLLRLAPYVWTYFLGWVCLSVIAMRAESLARKVVESYRANVPWVGLFMALAWHLTWAAASGMETLLYGLIVFIVLGMLMENSRQYLTLGLLAGLSIWVRPDGLTLLGPILLLVFIQEETIKLKGSALFKVSIGFGVLFIFYLLFNLALSGSPMPNTFYAKQAEYGAYWQSVPFKDKIINYLLPIVASPFVALLPGLVFWLYRSIQAKHWGRVAGFLWAIGYIGVYFMRLPAYQHGRYIIPAFPFLYFGGLLGMLRYIYSSKSRPRVVFIWGVAVVILLFSFQLVGSQQNADDVTFVESQMVETARWVNENLPADAVLGVHDIGAIGYFTQNPIVDLAGLVTPDVVPFIRDENRLSDFMDSTSVRYLVTFPAWYPELTMHRIPVFDASNPVYPFQDKMTVFIWQ